MKFQTNRHGPPALNNLASGTGVPELDIAISEADALTPNGTKTTQQQKIAFERVILEGLLFAAVFTWSDVFKDTFARIFPGKGSVLAQIGFAVLLTAAIVFFAQKLNALNA